MVFLASSRIYVQNLIHFDKFCHINASTRKIGYGRIFFLTNTALTGKIMKKFSTAARLLALAPLFASFAASAQEAVADQPAVEQPAGPITCTFLPNAPDQHLVVKGDTLWDISAKFLEHPWCWPQVWGLNKDQISNPHWIYPGQIVYFDRVAGRLRLGTPRTENDGGTEGAINPTVHLSPQLRMQGIGREAVPSIPSGVIEPFLSQPLIIEENEFKNTPHIMATEEGHLNLGKNDKAYVRGDLKGGTSFQVFRPGLPLKDPGTKKIIGYEAVFLGTLKLQRAAKAANEAHTFTVVSSKEEMAIGDRLVPVPPTPIVNYMPHPPVMRIDARIVSIYGGVTQAGQNQIVTVNKGAADGLDKGSVLELLRYGEIVADRVDGKKGIKLPDERYGALFVFRVFKHISYGLVMQVSDTVQVGDVAKSPE
jgi:hypothetical protein